MNVRKFLLSGATTGVSGQYWLLYIDNLSTGGGNGAIAAVEAPNGDILLLFGNWDSRYIMHFDTTGVLKGTVRLSGDSNTQYNSIATAADGFYVVGHEYVAEQYRGVLVKFDYNRTILWKTGIDDDGSYSGFIQTVEDVAVDGAGSVYITGGLANNSNVRYAAKLSSAGALLWQRQFNLQTQPNRTQKISISGTDLIIGAALWVSGRFEDPVLMKLNSSTGEIVYGQQYGGAGMDRIYAVSIDTARNRVYGAVELNGSTANFVSVDLTTGSSIWSSNLTGGQQGGSGAITHDPTTGSVFYGRRVDGEFGELLQSNGSRIWGRKLYAGTSASYGVKHLAITGDGSLLVTSANNTAPTIVGKLPMDGSGIGTYGPITYETSSTVSGAATISEGSVTITNSATGIVLTATAVTESTDLTRFVNKYTVTA